jgi:hypothetical protein
LGVDEGCVQGGEKGSSVRDGTGIASSEMR